MEADGFDAPTINEKDTLLRNGNKHTTRDGGDNYPSFDTDIQASMDERYGIRNGCYDLRPWRERNTNGWNSLLVNPVTIQDESTGEETMLTQYNVKQGLKIFGKAGELAISTELEQVHSRMVIEPKHPHEAVGKELMHCGTLCS